MALETPRNPAEKLSKIDKLVKLFHKGSFHLEEFERIEKELGEAITALNKEELAEYVKRTRR